MNPSKVVQALSESLVKRGFDLVHPFQVQWYNQAVHALHAQPQHSASAAALQPLPTFGLPETLGVLIGNTKSLWPPFLHFLHSVHFHELSPGQTATPGVGTATASTAASTLLDCTGALDPGLLHAHPVRVYTEACISSAVKSLADQVRQEQGHELEYDIRFDFTWHPKLVDMQLLAEISAFAFRNRQCMLVVHEKYGPWVSFRAAVSMNVKGPSGSPPPTPSDPVPELADGIRCAKDAAFQAPNSVLSWIALRDAATSDSAREHRFTEGQLLYHYTKNVDALREEVRKN